MSRSYALKDSRSENKLFLNRISIIFLFVLLLILGLCVRLVYLQIVGHEHYTTLAKDNRIKITPLPPTRGIIYDRNGKILAENTPSYSLELIPEQIPDMDETLAELQSLLTISEDKIKQFRILTKRHKRFASIPLLIRMSDEEISKFAVVRPFFPGVDIHARLVRHYPYAELTSHVIGYVGRINEQELKTLPIKEYRGSHHTGKNGIEKTYESELHGHTGYAEIETNALGRPIKTLEASDPEPGANIYLTLDVELQKTAYEALDKFNGAIAAIEILTGDTLVFVSRPGYDPNPFVSGISTKAYKALQESDDRPLFNRALRGLYPPGSTVKPFIGLAGLYYHIVDIKKKMYCPGFYQLPNVKHKYRDWKRWGHGMVNLKDSIVQSCDVYFYDLARSMGIDRLHSFMTKFGFGEKTGIDLIGEKAGLMPSRTWKRNQKNLPWYPGETLITGIGQGFSQVTVLQLARATATLANFGTIVSPKLVKRIVRSKTANDIPVKTAGQLPLKRQNVVKIINSMIDVVHSPRGTAKRISKGIDFLIAGKTGTAQVFTVKQEEKYNEKEIDFKLRDHALFIAFAPADDPKIAVAVIAENGGHGGSVAAPIAATIIKQYIAGLSS